MAKLGWGCYTVEKYLSLIYKAVGFIFILPF